MSHVKNYILSSNSQSVSLECSHFSSTDRNGVAISSRLRREKISEIVAKIYYFE